MKQVIVAGVALLGFAALIGGSNAGDKDKPLTIKQIMAKAFKGKAYQKLEKAELVTLFTDLSKNTPPAGDEASWKSKTEALIAAAKSGDAAKLNAAANCGACHNVHQKKKAGT